MHRSGELTERIICDFARTGRFEEVTVARSLLCSLPADVTERALLDEQGEMPLIVAKAANLSWATTKILLSLCPQGAISSHDLDEALKNFSALSVASARKVIEFYRLRRE